MSGQAGNRTAMFPAHRRQDAATFGDGNTSTTGEDLFRTQRNGHTGAFDPRSGHLVHFWRLDDTRIAVSLSDNNGGPLSAPVPLVGQRAAYTPSVSCGPASIPYNCMVIWAHLPNGTDEHYYTTKHTQFRVNRVIVPGGVELEIEWAPTVWETIYLQYGPPSVAYKGPEDSDSAFVIAWKAPGGCFFTNFKRSGALLGVDQLALANEQEHCNPYPCDPSTPTIKNCAQIGPPAVGADSTNHVADAWVVGNHYFTFPL